MFRKKYHIPTSDLYFRFAVDHYNSNNKFKIQYKIHSPHLIETINALIAVRYIDDIILNKIRNTTKKIYYIIDDNYEAIINSDEILDTYREKIIDYYKEYHSKIIDCTETVVCCSNKIAELYKEKQTTILDPYWPLSTQQLNNSTAQQPNNIGWLGSRSHLCDLETIAPQVRKFLSENNHINFHVFLREEHVPDWLKDLPNLVIHLPLKWNKYLKKISKINFDLCLYPLNQNDVNSSRSINKLLEHFYIDTIGLYPEWFIKEKAIKLDNKFIVNNNFNSWYDALSERCNSTKYRQLLKRHNECCYKLNENAYQKQVDFWTKELL